MTEVIPLWFWMALLLATVATGPTMRQRWRTLRAIRVDRPTPFDAFYMITSRIWLPAVAVAIPVAYIIRLLIL